ncbi:DoxX family protein [Aeromonas caviae]|uniref:DoxX family protein n=1 Tax=Aeromonas TaxID=642 RepID=UPI0011655406|nr:MULTISPECIES: DoxX family protein [Aeromonas]MBP4066845.1 DoxX family protein [Aeromonas sp. MaB10011B]MBP4077742.1 DoxX family protein [Aeromonas sp. MrichA-1]QDO74201.1 DoxX family protein [Aeromonas caviae]
MDKMKDVALLVGRVLLALMFVMAGWGKIGGYAGTQGYMEAMGVPGFMLVILLELGGGLAIMLGLFTRSLSVLLAGFTLMAAFIFHYQPAEQMQMLMFMKNVSVAGGFLALAAAGPGAFSLDARLGKHW